MEAFGRATHPIAFANFTTCPNIAPIAGVKFKPMACATAQVVTREE